MPIKADVLDGCVIPLRELTLHVAQHDPHDQSHADDDMETVDARHHEVDGEEGPGVARLEACRTEVLTGQQAIVELMAVLEVLDHEECGGTCERDREQDGGFLGLVLLSRTNGKSHREARADEDDGIDTTHHAIEMMVCLDKRREVLAPKDGKRAEEAAEEQDFRDEEEPHAHATGVELVRGCVEVVGDVELRREFRRVHVIHGVSLGAHQWVS